MLLRIWRNLKATIELWLLNIAPAVAESPLRVGIAKRGLVAKDGTISSYETARFASKNLSGVYPANGGNANGNITSLFRNAVGGMDDMTYSYLANTNKLTHVSDAVASSNYATDIDNQSANNYDYDPTGNLIKDEQEEIASIEWNVYGKVKKITRDAGSVKPDLEFKYDATGNRISKTVKPRTTNGLTDATEWTTTFYTRDAQGNIMAMYENNFVEVGPAGEFGTLYKEQLRLKETPIYGSKRVGIKNSNILLDERSFTGEINSITKEFMNVIEGSDPNYISPGLSSLCGAGERGKGIIQLSGPNVGFAEIDVEFFVDGVSINQPLNWQGPTYTATALANAINSFVSSPDYTAEATNDQVIIYTVTETDDLNGMTISGTHTLNWSYTVASNINGGKEAIPCERVMGKKVYELVNATQDVIVTVSDKKIGIDNDFDGAFDNYSPDVLSTNDLYPGGSLVPNRNFNSSEYDFGVSTQEKVDEISGTGNHYTAEFWEYDPRSIKRWNKDQIKKPRESPYAVFSNNPILFNDPLGLQSMGPEDDFNGNENPEQMNIYSPSKYGEEDYRTSRENYEMSKILNTVYRKDVKDLSVSAKGKAFIASWEQGPDGGAALKIYDDKNKKWKPGEPVKGTLTIGYGHKILADEDYSKGITKQEAEDLLESDILDKSVNPIKRLVKAPLSQQEFDALVSYVFNTGSLNETKLLKNINSKNYSEAVKEMDINTQKGEFVQGLENRRVDERKIWNYGTYTNHQ